MLTVWAVSGIGEIGSGDDLGGSIEDRVDPAHPNFSGSALADGDIIAITSKIVSKAEGRICSAGDREGASAEETVRVAATRRHLGGITRIVETPLGLVMAAAGVDSSIGHLVHELTESGARSMLRLARHEERLESPRVS